MKYPFTPTPFGPLIYLTNQSCEDTGFWNKEEFETCHVDYGLDYPLTEEEERYVGEFVTATPIGGKAMFGYSVFWQKKKWLAIRTEHLYDEYNADFLQKIYDEQQKLSILASFLGGAVVLDHNCSDCVVALTCFPFQEVRQWFSGFDLFRTSVVRAIRGEEWRKIG